MVELDPFYFLEKELGKGLGVFWGYLGVYFLEIHLYYYLFFFLMLFLFINYKIYLLIKTIVVVCYSIL